MQRINQVPEYPLLVIALQWDVFQGTTVLIAPATPAHDHLESCTGTSTGYTPCSCQAGKSYSGPCCCKCLCLNRGIASHIMTGHPANVQ